jgi:two-component system response regulator AtoC
VRRILVVDDDQSICESLELYLKEEGFEVITCMTGEEGLRKYEETMPVVTIVDLRLPDMSGLEVLERVKADYPEACIIVITAFQDMDTTITAMKQGAFEYIHKPIDIDELEAAVKKAIESCQAAEGADYLLSEAGASCGSCRIIGKSHAMTDIFKTVGVVSSNRATVLIVGESGTGKELIARVIHCNTDSQQPFVAVNCSAIVDTLLESELFAHEKGSFTGAVSRKLGRFEIAGYGTIFLDEIGEMSPNLQAKLLRALQERTFERVGGHEEIELGARIIAATNQNLEELVAQGVFREDLYYRLSVIRIEVPPLRERKEDIPLLVDYFLNKLNGELHKNVRVVPKEAMDALVWYDWKGNVRELENVLTRAVILARGESLSIDALPELRLESEGQKGESYVDLRSMGEVEKEHVQEVLSYVKGHKGRACEILKISRPTLERKIKKFGLTA